MWGAGKAGYCEGWGPGGRLAPSAFHPLCLASLPGRGARRGERAASFTASLSVLMNMQLKIFWFQGTSARTQTPLHVSRQPDMLPSVNFNTPRRGHKRRLFSPGSTRLRKQQQAGCANGDLHRPLCSQDGGEGPPRRSVPLVQGSDFQVPGPGPPGSDISGCR